MKPEMLLYGKPVVEHLRQQTKAYIDSLERTDIYIAHLLLNDDDATRVYARLKANYATSIGIHSQTHELRNASPTEVFAIIEKCNTDDACVGIIVQLPVAERFAAQESEFLTAVTPHKDIDGLSGVVFGNSLIGKGAFVPATPRAVFEVLAHYGFGDLQWKTVAVISQSNLIGKPVALELMNQWATVLSCNERTSPARLAELCAMSDIIVSATGVVHLITAEMFEYDERDNKMPQSVSSWPSRIDKVIIDVGRWIKDGKAVWDTDRESLQAAGAHITPVPWGIWPVTIACVFDNIRVLQESKKI